MSSRILVDTLFVIALINKHDQYHQRASELADQFEGQPLGITAALTFDQHFVQAGFDALMRDD